MEVGRDVLSGKPHTRINRTKHGRREFIKKVAIVGGGSLVGVIGGSSLLKSIENTGSKSNETDEVNQDGSADNPSHEPTRPIGTVEKIFGYLSGSDKKVLEPYVEHELSRYKGSEFKSAIEDTIKFEAIVNEALKIMKFSSHFDVNGNNINLQKLFLGLILTESNGNPKSGSVAGARGLCQLMMSTAEPIYNEMKKTGELAKFGITKFDLEDPKTNIVLGLKYFEELMRVYYDPTVALWAYNLGMKNMNRLIRTYVQEQISKMPDSWERKHAQTDFEKSLSDVKLPGTSQLVERYNITFPKLNSSKAVQRVIGIMTLEPATLDDKETLVYVPRITAATRIISAA